jgi:hypothetical protein
MNLSVTTTAPISSALKCSRLVDSPDALNAFDIDLRFGNVLEQI